MPGYSIQADDCRCPGVRLKAVVQNWVRFGFVAASVRGLVRKALLAQNAEVVANQRKKFLDLAKSSNWEWIPRA
jgi:hypothetical protein